MHYLYDVRAILNALDPGEREVVEGWLDLVRIGDPGNMPSGWAALLEVVAVERLMARYRREGMDDRDALHRACRNLGVDPKSYATRLRRWTAVTRRHSVATPTARLGSTRSNALSPRGSTR